MTDGTAADVLNLLSRYAERGVPFPPTSFQTVLFRLFWKGRGRHPTDYWFEFTGRKVYVYEWAALKALGGKFAEPTAVITTDGATFFGILAGQSLPDAISDGKVLWSAVAAPLLPYTFFSIFDAPKPPPPPSVPLPRPEPVRPRVNPPDPTRSRPVSREEEWAASEEPLPPLPPFPKTIDQWYEPSISNLVNAFGRRRVERMVGHPVIRLSTTSKIARLNRHHRTSAAGGRWGTIHQCQCGEVEECTFEAMGKRWACPICRRLEQARSANHSTKPAVVA